MLLDFVLLSGFHWSLLPMTMLDKNLLLLVGALFGDVTAAAGAAGAAVGPEPGLLIAWAACAALTCDGRRAIAGALESDGGDPMEFKPVLFCCSKLASWLNIGLLSVADVGTFFSTSVVDVTIV